MKKTRRRHGKRWWTDVQPRDPSQNTVSMIYKPWRIQPEQKREKKKKWLQADPFRCRRSILTLCSAWLSAHFANPLQDGPNVTADGVRCSTCMHCYPNELWFDVRSARQFYNKYVEPGRCFWLWVLKHVHYMPHGWGVWQPIAKATATAIVFVSVTVFTNLMILQQIMDAYGSSYILYENRNINHRETHPFDQKRQWITFFPRRDETRVATMYKRQTRARTRSRHRARTHTLMHACGMEKCRRMKEKSASESLTRTAIDIIL